VTGYSLAVSEFEIWLSIAGLVIGTGLLVIVLIRSNNRRVGPKD
jgi:hypothetical protein